MTARYCASVSPAADMPKQKKLSTRTVQLGLHTPDRSPGLDKTSSWHLVRGHFGGDAGDDFYAAAADNHHPFDGRIQDALAQDTLTHHSTGPVINSCSQHHLIRRTTLWK